MEEIKGGFEKIFTRKGGASNNFSLIEGWGGFRKIMIKVVWGALKIVSWKKKKEKEKTKQKKKKKKKKKNRIGVINQNFIKTLILLFCFVSFDPHHELICPRSF